MKLNAYILAADPAWIEASVLSYYDVVGRIVVSYDHDGRGWTGASIDVEQCLRRLKAIDHQHKLVFSPGRYARSEYFDRPIESETYQRQQALDEASQDADWVIQLDTDEIMGNPRVFMAEIEKASRNGQLGLNYPALWFYSHVGGRWYTEWCRRGWRRAPGYPGTMAIRSGTRLNLARRINENVYHVDLTWDGSPIRFPNGIPVHSVIARQDAIFHLSFVRDEQWLRRKFSTWGHAKDRDWHPEVDRWLWSQRHPLFAVIKSQFSKRQDNRPLMLTAVPDFVADLIRHSCVYDRESVISSLADSA